MEMELQYDNAYIYDPDLSAENKPRNYQSLFRSKTSLVLINLLVISLVVSVVSLVITLVLAHDAQTKLEEKFATMEAANAELKTKVQKLEGERTTVESDNSDQSLSLSSLQQQLRATVEGQEVLMQSLGNFSAQVSSELSISQNKTQQDLQEMLEAQQQLKGSLQDLSMVVSTELNATLQETQQGLQRLSDETSSYHPLEAPISCPSGYTHNPYANSCIRLVSIRRNWVSAKSSCESAGERLATFETLESQYWFITLQKTSWKASAIWVGGEQFTTGSWRWIGERPTQMVLAVWGPDEPNYSHQQCMCSTANEDYRFDDGTCSDSFYFVCERK